MARDFPVPGDLVIREERRHHGIPPLFVVTLYPNRTFNVAPYSDLRTPSNTRASSC